MYRLTRGSGLVLASASPRRREMLTHLGLNFRLAPAHIDENLLPGESAAQAAQRLASAKAAAVHVAPNDTVLAADTLVVLGEEIMGKPKDALEAAQMLRKLSGAQHEVLTGYCLLNESWQKVGLGRSLVTFRKLSDAEIAAYVATGEAMDKAGAYAVQGLGGALVKEVSGSYTNVVGLPLAAVIEMLLEQGLIEPQGAGA
ncbi:MAG: Maf family protein [Desulfarculus sp.]|nr:septum formation inhibitor Maf [Pseudomonadota bacterium]MBV1714739.1 Maf family protein [Desulfarculus sp.]MBU4573941.1 septum formation inhibitor Maf [Pseudomonadota bacterium]MBU4600075.1 septum formation inhibitor Maf [Pseudomonadota bacterium]MBV1736965.1 Maf family protein [Desulfarculus sp.]